jgi:hypothetical protein
MDLMRGELRNHLDPTALRILKKRLVSGKITPQVFKDILKRQMVKYFFQSYRHPLINSWENWRQSAPKRLGFNRNTALRPKSEKFEIYEHKRF